MEKQILEKNKKVLQKRYPEIWADIEKYNFDSEEDCADIIDGINLIETRDEEKCLEVYREGKTIRLNSKYSPMIEAKRWADQYEYDNVSAHIILYGMGSGLIVREMLERIGKGCIMFLVEPDYQIFARLLTEVDVSDIIGDERIELFFYHKQAKEIKQRIYSVLGWGNLSTIIRAIHPGYEKVYPVQILDYIEVVRRLFEQIRVYYDTNIFYSKVGLANVINALQYVRKSNYINELIDIFPEGYPAIVVSAGPSLQKNMEHLRQLKDKAFVLVVDTAVKVMEENQIPYDAIVLIDPKKPAEFLTDYPSCREKPLFCLTESQTAILDFHTGRKIWLPEPVLLERIYKRNGYAFVKHDSGGSVATMATEVARIVGCTTIILMGQDLAYQGELTHAGREKPMGEEREYKSVWIDGVYEEKVRSRWDWIYFLHWFEKFIGDNPDITLVDATEGGALIHGSKVMTIADAEKEYCHTTFSFDEFLTKLPYTFDVNDFSGVKEDICSMKPDLEALIRQSEEGKKDLVEYFQNKSISTTKLDQILNKCMNRNDLFAGVLSYELVDLGISGILQEKLKDINQITGDEIKDKENSAKMLMDYYDAVIEVANNLIKMLEDVYQKMEK